LQATNKFILQYANHIVYTSDSLELGYYLVVRNPLLSMFVLFVLFVKINNSTSKALQLCKALFYTYNPGRVTIVTISYTSFFSSSNGFLAENSIFPNHKQLPPSWFFWICSITEPSRTPPLPLGVMLYTCLSP
jgi:hypothetical protein